MVDTEGIDCLVDVGEGNYKEIQVKYREKTPLFQVRKFKPRTSFYIVCCVGRGSEGERWVIPSRIFHDMGTLTKASGREYTRLTIGREGSDSYERLRPYSNNFGQLLKGATKEVRKVVQQASRRIEKPHFKQADFEIRILEMLAFEERPLTRKQMIEKLDKQMHSEFSQADLAMIKSGVRWERTARWAQSNLKRKGLIGAKSKNQYIITPEGNSFLWKASHDISK